MCYVIKKLFKPGLRSVSITFEAKNDRTNDVFKVRNLSDLMGSI